MEPAAVLVVAFQVEIGLGAVLVRRAWCEPLSTVVCVVPESNHTSRMSWLLV